MQSTVQYRQVEVFDKLEAISFLQFCSDAMMLFSQYPSPCIILPPVEMKANFPSSMWPSEGPRKPDHD
jgi:hypothetical protein